MGWCGLGGDGLELVRVVWVDWWVVGLVGEL